MFFFERATECKPSLDKSNVFARVDNSILSQSLGTVVVGFFSILYYNKLPRAEISFRFGNIKSKERFSKDRQKKSLN